MNEKRYKSLCFLEKASLKYIQNTSMVALFSVLGGAWYDWVMLCFTTLEDDSDYHSMQRWILWSELLLCQDFMFLASF